MRSPTRANAATRGRRKVFADGSVGLSIEQTTPVGCQVNPPVNCFLPRTTVLRFEADGTERWRADLGEFRPARVVAFEDDGTSIVITTPADADMSVATIAPDGAPGAAVTVSDSVGAYATHASGPVNGRYLIQTSPSSVSTLRLLDRTGATLQTLPVDFLGYGMPIASGAYGFIVAAETNDGTLLAPDTLAPGRVFRYRRREQRVVYVSGIGLAHAARWRCLPFHDRRPCTIVALRRARLACRRPHLPRWVRTLLKYLAQQLQSERIVHNRVAHVPRATSLETAGERRKADLVEMPRTLSRALTPALARIAKATMQRFGQHQRRLVQRRRQRVVGARHAPDRSRAERAVRACGIGYA